MRAMTIRSAAGVGLVLAVLAASGCMQHESRYGPGVRYNGLGRTFAWYRQALPASGETWWESPYMHELLQRSITEQFAAKGYAQQTSGTPDFWIDYHVLGSERSNLLHGTMAMIYREGSLIIDVIDPQTHKVIWRGYAQAQFQEPADPAAKKKHVYKTVCTMLKQFPDQGVVEDRIEDVDEHYAHELEEHSVAAPEPNEPNEASGAEYDPGAPVPR